MATDVIRLETGRQIRALRAVLGKPRRQSEKEMPEHDMHSRQRGADSAEVRANALRRTQDDPEGLLQEYRRRFGNVLNADNAAELFPEYAASPASRAQFRPAVHPAAQWVRDKLFTRALADPLAALRPREATSTRPGAAARFAPGP